MTDQPAPAAPEPPPSKTKYTVNATGKGVVVGDFNTVVQNFLADPRLRWYLAGLAVLIIGAAAALYFLLAPHKDPRAWNGNWHIAVANFVVEGGGAGERDLGDRVAKVVYSTMTGDMRELIASNQIEVRDPGSVGRISGASAKERADAASRVAKAINAHMVIYGVVQVSGLDYTITPEFYINPDPNTLNPAGDKELTGPNELGAPQEISGPVEAGFDQELRSRMSERLQVLAVMSMGLANYSTHRYDLALGRFEDAKAMQWPEDMSKELLYLMIANATGKVGQENFTKKQFDVAQQKFTEAEAIYTQAEQEYDRAHPSAPGYARAMIGQGSVLYMRVLLQFNASGNPAGIDRALLAKSIASYQSALDSPNKPDGADVTETASMGIGQCYILQKLAGDQPNFALATAAFQVIIHSYDQSHEPRLQELAGDAHARLGLIHRLEGNTAAAIQEYQTAVDLLAVYPQEQKIYQTPLAELRKK